MEEQQMNNPTTKVALYIRSTEPDNECWQLESLRSICQLENKDIVQIYIDRGFSGLRMNRTSLQQLLSNGKDHAFDEVMVISLNKLARYIRDFAQILVVLLTHGVIVFTPDRSLNLNNVLDRFALQSLTAIDDYDMSFGAERC